MVKSLSVEMEKMKFEGKQSYKNAQNVDNRGTFKIPNHTLVIGLIVKCGHKSIPLASL
jgi:hypothetical protein